MLHSDKNRMWSDSLDGWSGDDTPRVCSGGGGNSGGGGGGGTNTTVQKSDPWSGQQPYLTDVMGKAQETYNRGPMQYYTGQTYAPLSAETQVAQDLQAQRALSGSSLTTAAQDQLTKTMRGDYLDPATNPYLNAGAEQIRAKVLPQIDARFSGSGRTGSALAARAAGEGVSDAIASQAMQNYTQERQNQIRGMMFAPQMAQADYQDIARLGEVGAAKEDYQQQAINEDINRFNFQQQEPWQNLGLYSNLVNGQYGSTVSTTAPAARRSVGAGLLGGGATGAGLGYMLGGGDPYATAGGAALGGLLGSW
jgi:hypothetical protein